MALEWLERRLPRRLVTRVTLAVVVIVVAAGLITTAVVNQLLVHHLRAEHVAAGRALTLTLGESLANALVESDLAAVQEAIDSIVHSNEDVAYVFAFGPTTPIVHTFPGGFPADLLQLTPVTGSGTLSQGVLLRTEHGLVRDFGYRPLDGLPAEVHVGISQARIAAAQRQMISFVLALTAAGCLLAAGIAYGFSRVATHPLRKLMRGVQRLGQGHFDERILLPPGDEVSDLAAAFNQMAADIQQAIRQLQASEAGYRVLLNAASAVGEGIALISDDEHGSDRGTFLFVNEAFARLAGFRPSDLVGVNAASVLHPNSLDAARRAWEAIQDGTTPTTQELTLVDRRGRTHVLETAGAQIEYRGRRALAWFARDISERKAREQELRRRNRELNALNAVASAVSNPVPAEAMLERALDALLAALELKVGWILVVNEQGRARLAAQRGMDNASCLDFTFPECRCGSVLLENAAAVIPVADQRCILGRAHPAGVPPLTCHASAPLQAHGRSLGVLSVAAAGVHTFDDADLHLLTAVGQQIGVALENAQLWHELRQKEQMRAALLAQAIRAQEEERRRVARELHDGIGQSLNALVFGLNAISTALSQGSPIVPELVARLKLSTSDTVKELQEIIYDLRPSLLDDLGLCRALRWYAEERLQRRGVEVFLDLPEDLQRLPSEIETALFRIGQEAITNVTRHAQASRVRIRLEVNSRDVSMSIQDDGIGFSPGQALAQSERRAWGLLGMQERASLLGGRLTIESQPGQGTRVSVILPLNAEKRP